MVEKVVDFNKWLFDNNIVPNSSFLWFDHTLSNKEVCFYELKDLFEAFDSKKTISEFKIEQQNRLEDMTKELLM